MDTADLEQLLARLADGDRGAFAPAFRLLWPAVLRLCRTLLRFDSDAEDAAQQAIEKVFARVNDYDPSRRALPWALAIASWECRSVRQKRLRRREEPEGVTDASALLDPEEEHVKNDLLRAAQEAMGTLSAVDQETLLATFSEEASDLKGATFRKRRERALSRLRAAMRKLYGLD